MEKRKKIFLIDDDRDDRIIFTAALKELDEEVLFDYAVNGQEAIDKLSSSDNFPDYIFLDINMPRMDGRQCLTEIKKIKKLCAIPVIMYSTTQRTEEVEETKKAGAAAFLTKPTNFGDLVSMIAAVLSGKYG